ncbi:ImpA family type VI secretion system protein [Novosphingobium album (ex Liu et al. 2023)]|uniref:Type VI secretion system ImpA family N-terminal domain-containing protein n=1 Tax=Novosphingobium album (ex Liu et al. 2023) TaxID=3031130 RepID=A0ABT5WUX2_9SPHN|nr:type VI secretion system ImpA family N-terminal domain-containing protein [Novosphingobium album (ex Liu et al. 2023)]MDE8653705.1 type VI secretion system ImpA family N-terminal domain-containing protein [Novosphingobium album (ex Liu et al. 2023)]
MGLDIGVLVAPLSEQEPSGPDLFESADRQEIEIAFDRSISDASGEGAHVDWRGVIQRILAQAEVTRDLWLAVYLMRAAAHSGQFELVADGAELLAALVEERWADVHPQLDEVGFIGRKTPCEALTRIGEFLGPLKAIPLLAHPRLGSVSGNDLLRFMDEGSNAEGFGLFRAILDATPPEDLQELAARIERLLEAVRRTDRALTEQAQGDTSTNFELTYDTIERVRRALVSNLPGGMIEDVGEGLADLPAPPPISGGAGGLPGEIKSRDDVVRALDSICTYYARYEPASPVPFALRRARDWISLDFMEILEDIAPGSVQEAVTVLKSRNSNSGGSNDGWN